MAGRAVFAALTRLLSPACRLPWIVTPSAILRWRRALVTQRWTPLRRRTAGRRTAPELRRLVLRLAAENSSRRHQREEVATFFLSLFPLVLVSVLGYTLEGDPAV